MTIYQIIVFVLCFVASFAFAEQQDWATPVDLSEDLKGGATISSGAGGSVPRVVDEGSDDGDGDNGDGDDNNNEGDDGSGTDDGQDPGEGGDGSGTDDGQDPGADLGEGEDPGQGENPGEGDDGGDSGSGSDDDTGGAPPVFAACADGIDNDGDGFADYPDDPGCDDLLDDDESNSMDMGECMDGMDNDGDGLVDYNDPSCMSSAGVSESGYDEPTTGF